MPAFLDRIVRSLEDGWDRGNDITRDNPTTVALIGAGAVLVGGYWLSQSRNSRKPGTTQLSGGGIARSEVKKEFADYSKAYSEQPGAGIKERSRTTELVDTFCEDPSFDAAKQSLFPQSQTCLIASLPCITKASKMIFLLCAVPCVLTASFTTFSAACKKHACCLRHLVC